MEHGSNVDKSLRREQFPLVLAWALKHWKCQGMTLRRSRVRIGRRGAATAGVPFTTITRVKHPRHLIFDSDLPDFDALQNVQYTEAFRARRRYELQLAVGASATLRRYGFCEADR